jgi:nicotinate phosphoribosyltransferase
MRADPDGIRVDAIRLDSGDLLTVARQSRDLLDAAGLRHVDIFASSDLDEHEIAGLVRAGAPIGGFGVGTAMGVSQDAPALDIVYKLTEYAGVGRTKLSLDKPVLPGRTQLFRYEEHGKAVADVIGRAGETLPARELLQPVMSGGQIRSALETDLHRIRQHAAEETERLPAHAWRLEAGESPYPVRVSDALEAYHVQVRERIASR